jgi:hypothetical protein
MFDPSFEEAAKQSVTWHTVFTKAIDTVYT